MTAAAEYTPDEAIAGLWLSGDVSYLLHETQETMRQAIRDSGARLFVLNCARRLGKSYLCCVLAIETCLTKAKARVLYIAPTAKQVRTIITPHMRAIITDAPAKVRPVFGTMDGIWRFPNGSEIQLVGVNNDHADTSVRGGDADLVIIDEAGQIDSLDYLHTSVIKPTLLVTDGRVVMASTPAPTPAHPFTGFCARAEAEGSYARFTLYDAPHIPRERADEFIAEDGGRFATSVRREYFCEFVVDDSLAVLPEFSRVQDDIIGARERPEYFTPIIVADIGYHDLTFVVGGYHDFRAGVDVIEWEYVTSKTIARDIGAKVSELATQHWEARAAEAMRYADAPPIVIAEMSGWHGIAKTQTDGNWKSAVVNDVRTRLAEKSTRIHPRCEQLIAHCRYAVWRVPGRDLERTAGFGHFDGVDALAYFTRLVDRTTNPFPARARGVTRDTHWLEPREDEELEQQLAGRWRAPRGARR